MKTAFTRSPSNKQFRNVELNRALFFYRNLRVRTFSPIVRRLLLATLRKNEHSSDQMGKEGWQDADLTDFLPEEDPPSPAVAGRK